VRSGDGDGDVAVAVRVGREMGATSAIYYELTRRWVRWVRN